MIKENPCEFTDDSVMTVAVADALLHRNEAGSDDGFKRLLIERMHYHGEKRLNAGYGNLFYDWLTMGKTEPYNSYGNGAAMRVSPCGIVAKSLEEAQHLAEISASISHNHPEADGGINILDETLNINWRIPLADAILSEKDLKHTRLADAILDFDIKDNLY